MLRRAILQIKIPTTRQVYNHKANKQTEKGPKMHFAKLLIHCQVNSQLPEDEDKPFIIKYQIRVDESDVVDGPELPEEQFRIAISTKRLLRLAGKQDDGTREFTLQVDSTYKLVWNGFPVLVFGFTDLDTEMCFRNTEMCFRRHFDS